MYIFGRTPVLIEINISQLIIDPCPKRLHLMLMIYYLSWIHEHGLDRFMPQFDLHFDHR